MATSRSSTPAGGKRAAKRATASTPGSRKRTGGSHKQGTRTRASKPRAAAKPKSTKVRPPAKPKTARPKSAKPKRARPKAAKPKSARRKAITIALVAGTITLGLAAAYWFWFRDSSFVAVEKVTVAGIEGPEAAQVTDTLTRSAQGMTTLHVVEGELAAAVSRYPTVVAIQTEADFPHGLTVEVTDRPPTLTVSDGGPAVPVAGDGTLLHGVNVSGEELPAIQVDSVPVKGQLEGEPLALAQVAGATPAPLLPLIEGLAVDAGAGIMVTLKGGIPVKFGDPDELEEKWTAVSAVLADPQVKTLTHLDVRVPQRPSIGGAAPASKTE
jgi:cell division protein FtsQ